jgi:hypothetical protein
VHAIDAFHERSEPLTCLGCHRNVGHLH